MSALIVSTRMFATEELTLGMIAFQRTNSLPTALMAVSASMLVRAARSILNREMRS
jgi:hypothetical protein